MAQEVAVRSGVVPALVDRPGLLPHREGEGTVRVRRFDDLTLCLLALVRLLLPSVLLPATTALGTIIGFLFPCHMVPSLFTSPRSIAT